MAIKPVSRILMTLALAGMTGYSAAQDTIKIGIAGPITGPVSQYGELVRSGALTAVEQIDLAGGVNGRKLEAVKYDDACDPKQAVMAANRIVNDGIKFVVGHVCSNATIPAGDIYEEEGILMITPSATAPDLTDKKPTMIFRTIGLDNMQSPIASKYIAEVLKPKNVAIIHDKQQYGEGIATAIRADLQKAGINIAVFDAINVGDKDFSALITKMIRSQVDVVYYGGYHPELGQLLRQSREKGLKAQFFGPEGAANNEITAIAGDASEGLLVTMPKSYAAEPYNADLLKAFKEKNIDPSAAFVLPAYSAVQLIAQGIEKAGSDDPEEVAQALHSNTFNTATGPLSFDEKGDLKNFVFVIYQMHKDGTRTAVQ